MLNRLKSWFSQQEQQDTNIITPISMEQESFYPEKLDACPDNTWIFVWNTTTRNIGHVALQVGGSKPKHYENDPGEYLSLWPSKIPAFGPTVALPLPARLANTLEMDMLDEDSQNQATFLSDPEYHSLDTPFLVNPNGMSPDHIYSIPDLNTKAMKTKIANIKEAVDCGEQRYQLFPNINLIGFFRDAGACLSYDSVDMYQLALNNQRRKKATYAKNNCATLVADILKEGGLTIEQPNVFMGVTPNSVASQIHHHISMSNKS
jgi:hypothetical protein